MNAKHILLAAALIALMATASAATCPSIEQFGITWTFQAPYPECGQFVNGDWWVKTDAVTGNVKIIKITPESTDISGRIKNGSMLNPSSKDTFQGYDNAMPYIPYVASSNKAFGVSESNPLIIPPNSSLVSSIGIPNPNRTILDSVSVLTILSMAPPEKSFRPAYVGNNKTIYFSSNALKDNSDVLLSLNYPGSRPILHKDVLTNNPNSYPTSPDIWKNDQQSETVERMFERTWLDYYPDWVLSYMRPASSVEYYGREISTQVGIAAVMLNLDYSFEEKETLLTDYVQKGIDLYGVIQEGSFSNWTNDGGLNQGRKYLILFAGLMLDDGTPGGIDDEMRNIGEKTGDYLQEGTATPGHCANWMCTYPHPEDYIHFSLEDQTFYVSDFHVNATSEWIVSDPNHHPDPRACTDYGYAADLTCPHWIPYSPANIGLPEWGIRQATGVYTTNLWWEANYRTSSTELAADGWLLAAHMVGLRKYWNHNSLFDYHDRYMEIMQGMGFRSHSDFTENAWDTFRNNYGCIWTRDNQTPCLTSDYDNRLSSCYSQGYYHCAGDNGQPSQNLTCESGIGGVQCTGGKCQPDDLDVDGCEDYDNQRACEYDPCQLNSCNWNGNSCVPTTGTQCPGTDASCGTYPNCAACGSGKKCINNACQNIQCGEGQITSACYCQGTARTNGYCCSNVYQTTACTTPYYLVNIDFENGNNGSWTNYNPGNGTPTWQIVNDSGNGGTNALSLGGALNPVPNQTIPGAYRILNGTEAENFTLEAKIRSTSTATWRDLDIIFGYQNEQNQCNAIFNGGCDQVTNGIIKVTSGTKEKIGTQCTTGTLTDQQWHNVKIVKEGDNIQAYYDNMATPIFTATTAECGLGSFGFGSINDTGLIDDIKITSQDTAECVNGTALASYLSQWKAGNTTMPTMMQKIALWKSGAGC